MQPFEDIQTLGILRKLMIGMIGSILIFTNTSNAQGVGKGSHLGRSRVISQEEFDESVSSLSTQCAESAYCSEYSDSWQEENCSEKYVDTIFYSYCADGVLSQVEFILDAMVPDDPNCDPAVSTCTCTVIQERFIYNIG